MYYYINKSHHPYRAVLVLKSDKHVILFDTNNMHDAYLTRFEITLRVLCIRILAY